MRTTGETPGWTKNPAPFVMGGSLLAWGAIRSRRALPARFPRDLALTALP